MSVRSMSHHSIQSSSSRNDESSAERDEIRAGDFRLCIPDHEAYVQGRQLSLSPAEFDLLRFLLTHRKMLVAPQTILSIACGALNIRRMEFLKDLLSLKKKLDDATATGRYLHVEPWISMQTTMPDSTRLLPMCC